MDTQFIPLVDLLSAKPREEQVFLSRVVKRDLNPDGTDKGIIRRMDNDTCRRCHEEYKQKFPGQQFQIKCRGIYDEPFFLEKQAQMEALGESMSLDDIREIYDPAFWGERHIVVKNAEGDYTPFKPRWYQKDSLVCTATRKVDRWGRGLGKALAVDTPIPTPNGWTTMGELQPGDLVFDENGQPSHVTFVTDVMLDHVCYDVVFSDGSVITADAEHLWETWSKKARKAESRKGRRTGKLAHTRPFKKPSVVTTKEIRTTLFDGKDHNHSIPVCLPMEYPEKDLPIDPYVLGAWLGDGSSDASMFTTADLEILEEFALAGIESTKAKDTYGYSIGTKPLKHDPVTGRMISNDSLYSKLKALGVLSNKHVPRPYLEASIDQRLDLLQGLMDTDGNIREDGWAEFDNTNRNLSEAVFELATSLGMKPSLDEKPATLYGKECGIDYRVGFFPTAPVFRLQRKLDRIKPVTRPTVGHRYIVEIRERTSVPVKCIQVDSERHLYLAGRGCIPTHNTQNGVCEELHLSLTRKNLETGIICPQQTQSEQWYNEILAQVEHSPSLSDVLMGQKQSPFYLLRFSNGSIIKIFTAGSGSGKKGGAVRGQMHIRRIRLDEQDYLSEDDYAAIGPLVRRFKEITFHGSSTPTGLRGTFYRMCRLFPDHREFFHPINDHPDFNQDMQEACMREAKTTERYQHEYLAEFGSPTAGVFKSVFVDRALGSYKHIDMRYNPACRYTMGVDWNGAGTGTRIYIVEYDPETRRRRAVDRCVVDEPDSTTVKSIAQIKRLNKKWMCDYVYIDAGFGASQDELIRLEGQSAGKGDPQTYKLKNITKIDFGGTLEFNKLVPNREKGEKKKKHDEEKDEETRHTKPFMVEGAVMALEQEIVELSPDDDALLIEQMRGYRVNTWSRHGMPASYKTDSDSGDHDLDACMLALLAIEIQYGLYRTVETIHRLAQIAHVGSWGSGPTPSSADSISTPDSPGATPTENLRSAMRARAGMPSRLAQMMKNSGNAPRVAYSGRGMAYVTPGNKPQGQPGRVPSRTSFLTAQPGSSRSGASPFNTVGAGLIFNR